MTVERRDSSSGIFAKFEDLGQEREEDFAWHCGECPRSPCPARGVHHLWGSLVRIPPTAYRLLYRLLYTHAELWIPVTAPS